MAETVPDPGKPLWDPPTLVAAALGGLFFFTQYAVKDMPHWLSWAGMGVCLGFIVWHHISAQWRPTLFHVAVMGAPVAIIYSVVWLFAAGTATTAAARASAN